MMVSVQDALAARVAPDKLMRFVPWVDVMVPPQELVKPLGTEINNPAGSVSLKPTPLSGPLALGLLMVKLKVVEPPTGIVSAPNASLIAGGASTVTEAFEVFPAPALAEVT